MDVDGVTGPRVVTMLHVDPELSDAGRVDPIIARSPELAAFLRCDLKLPNPQQQAVMDVVCARYVGR